ARRCRVPPVFDSVSGFYRDRLSWCVGVPAWSLAPLVAMTAFLESMAWIRGAPPRVLAALFIWPETLAVDAAQALALPPASLPCALAAELVVFGIVVTSAIRFAQRRRYRRASERL